MECITCGKNMDYSKELHYNNFEVKGYKCSCGHVYIDGEDSMKISKKQLLQKVHLEQY